MANMFLAMPVRSDAGTVSVSQAAGENVGKNLQLLQPKKIWRTDNLTAISLEITLDAVAAVQVVFLGYSNLTSAATWQIRGATSIANLTASPGYNSGSIAFSPVSDQDTYDFIHGMHWIATAQSYQYWRIDLVDAANPDAYMQFGRLYIAEPFVPTFNMRYGWGGGVGDPSPVQKSEASSLIPKRLEKARVFQITLSEQSESDLWGEANKIDRLRGTSQDVLFCVDPLNTARQMDWTCCGLLSNPRLITNPDFDVYEKQWTLEETI